VSHDLHLIVGAVFDAGCGECTERARALPMSLGSLDRPTLVRAWSLMCDEMWGAGLELVPGEQPALLRASGARVTSELDYALVEQLYAFAVMLETTTGLSGPMVLEMMRAHG
jgi:hypothetical protein